ncbi:MAG: phosphatase PAP2 family protein [Alphaproteobacteria bacterium]|nr:phosphatase PAP2 family protein [Alphaproteobacteria bacterium]
MAQDETDSDRKPGDKGASSQIVSRVSARIRDNISANRAFLKRRRKSRPVMPRIRGFRYFLLVGIAVLLMAIVLDLPVGNYRRQWPDDVQFWADRLTDLAQSGWILVPTGVIVIAGYGLDWQYYSPRMRLALAKWISACSYVFLSVGVSGLIVAILKRVIGRARPVHFDELGAFSFQPFSDASFASFPSGHSTTAGALFAAIAIFFPALRIPALILGIWLGFTRILVGAHYPSDVIAGLAFGAWYAYFTALVFARYGFIFKYDDKGWPVRRKGSELVKLWRMRPKNR